MRFIFFTKTSWGEPPRLRHQLARLLSNAEHEVIFFEKPLNPAESATEVDSGSSRVHLFRSRQLFHHKLRLHPLLHYVNAAFEMDQIKRSLKTIRLTDSDVIVNFNYDYYFLREVFKTQKLITIINDDFWTRAIGGYDKPLRWALEKTCNRSDIVLTVSPVLAEQLAAFCRPELFYPWPDIAYSPPEAQGHRNILLYWGYIGAKLDYEYVARLGEHLRSSGSDLEFLFVGPKERGATGLSEVLNRLPGKTHPEMPLDELPLERIAAAIIPYRDGIPSIDVIALPNKASMLLARGIPIVFTGMPNFIEQPFVFRLSKDAVTDSAILQSVRDNFRDLQPSIKEFVEANSAESRLESFLAYAQ